MNDVQGWINLYKPKNITSFQALKKIKKKFLIKKIGHAGTLDPLAEGILPIALGKATKLIPFVGNNLKKYKFTVTWGTQTTTDDKDGEVINISKLIPNQNNIILNIKKFIGINKQVPPNFSAVKISGERAYKLSRKGKIFKINYKNVFVKDLKLLDHNYKSTKFEIICGKGFYIRSLARDLAKELGTYGHISALERLKVGKFTKETSILLDDLLKIGQTLSEINCILPSISMLDDILACEIEDLIDLKEISKGKSIKIDENKLVNFSSNLLDNKTIFLSNNGDIVSFGKLIGNLFKPNKVLI